MLTSIKNPRIQQIRKLQSSSRSRRDEQLFVVEGIRLVEESLQAGWKPQRVLYTPDLNPRGLELVEQFTALGVEITPVAPHVMQAASDTQTPQGILAVLPWRTVTMPTKLDFVVMIDGVRDPGNLGTILRTALAAGIQAVFMPPGNVDPLAPKVVRAAMGAHFKLAMLTLDWPEIQEVMARQELDRLPGRFGRRATLCPIRFQVGHGPGDRGRGGRCRTGCTAGGSPAGTYPHGRAGGIPERGGSCGDVDVRGCPPTRRLMGN